MKKLFTIVFLTLGYCSYSQKEANIWYFGSGAGLDFNSGVPVALTNSAMFAMYGCASISNAIGNIQFYTNGGQVWNKNNDSMQNGTGLIGSSSSTQSGLAVPMPGSKNLYYIFTIWPMDNTKGLYYSIVDMSLNSGLGGITTKNILLINSTSDKITAVNHSNKKSIWIITHGYNSSNFYSFLLTSSGINSSHIVSNCGSIQKLGIQGYMKASPDGKKIALSCGSNYGYTELYDFDNSSGIVSNVKRLKYHSYQLPGYGVEFSPDCNKLYITAYDSVINTAQNNMFQFDIRINDSTIINKSAYMVSYKNSIKMALQVGPDGKIYVAIDGSYYLGKINSPNNTGLNCNYTDTGIYLNGKVCEAGLPTMMQSYFFISDFNVLNTCFGDSTKFSLTSTYKVDSVIWNFGDISSGKNNISKSITPAHQYTQTGIYNVNLYIYHQGLLDSALRIVTISPYPKAKYIINDNYQCLKGNKVRFTNQSSISSGNMNYEWQYGDSTISYDTNTSHSYKYPDSFKVKLMAISDFGCTDSFTGTVYIKPSPLLNFSFNDSVQCLRNNSLIIKNLTKTFGVPSSWLWYFGDKSTYTGVSPPPYSYSLAGNYQVKLISNLSNGCKDSISKNAYMNPMPKACFSINDSAQCLRGNNFIFTNLSPKNLVKSQGFLWDFGDGGKDTAINTSHKYLAADTLIVKLKATSDQGCIDSTLKNIIINPSTIADFSINNSRQCLRGNSFLFSNKSILTGYKKPLPNNLLYHWDMGDKTQDTATNITYSYKVNDTFQVRLIATSMQGCSDTILKNIIVDPMPKADFTVNDSGQCLSGNNFMFTNKSTISSGTIGPPKSDWNFGDSNLSSSISPDHTYTRAGNFVVTLIAISNNQCKDTFTSKVYVRPQPVVQFNVDSNLKCLRGNSFNFYNMSYISSGSFSDLWEFGDGKSSTSGAAKVSYMYPTVKSYSVKLVTTSDYGCKDSIIKTATVRPNPKAIFISPDTSLCFNWNKFIFQNKSIINPGIFSSLWDFGDYMIATTPSPTHHYLSVNYYLVSLVAISNYGCKDSAEQMRYVRASPIPYFFALDSTECLKGNSFRYYNNSSISIGSFTNYWDFGDGVTDTVFSPNHIYKNADSFRVMLINTSTIFGCKDTFYREVYVRPSPVASFTLNDTAQCENTNQFIFNNQTQTNLACKYYWNFGDMDISTNIIPKHHYLTDGKYSIRLIATNIDNCMDSATGSVTVLPNPKADYQNTVGCLFDTIYFTDKSTMKAPETIKSWNWDFKNGNTSNSQNTSSVYLTAGAYGVMLIVGSNQGCYDTAIHYLNFYDHPQPPVIKYVSVVNNNEVSIEWIPSSLGVAKNYIIERSTDNNSYSTIGTVTNNITEINDDHVEAKKYSYYYRVYTIDSCNYQTGYSNVSKTILLKDTSGDRYTSIVWTAYLGWLNGVNNYDVQIYNDNQNGYETITTVSDTNYNDNQTKLDQESYCYRVTAHEKGSDVVSYSDSDCITTPLTGWVPNAFTPNHDGINDQLVIQGRFIVDYSMIIYNRWGVEVFHSTDVNKSWDGTYHGQPCEAGYYLFWVSFKGTRGQAKMVKGEVLLIK